MTTTLQMFQHSKDFLTFAPGETIFREGDSADKMYVVLEGQIEIVFPNQLVQSIGPGDILGEMALIEDRPRTGTAIAKTEVKVVPIDETRFNFLVQETPYFALIVMRIMAERLRRSMNLWA